MSGRRRPGRTVGLRFTLLYASVFLASGFGLLVLTNLLAAGKNTQVAPGQFPSPQQPDLAAAQQQIRDLQTRLEDAEAFQSRRLLVGSLIALVVMGLVSLLLGRLISGRVLRPLRTITAATRRISAENLHERLAVTGPADEVKDLADTVDGLLARLEASFAAQRRFVANASHELRTPLATMRASLDVAEAKPGPLPAQTTALAGRVRTELDRVDRLLDGLLMLARAQHGALADQAPVALGDLAGRALAARAADVEARRLTAVTAGITPQAWTEGNGTLLARMAQNLVDNAVLHNEDGGWLRVAVTADDGTVGLVVESGGPVLEQAQVDRLASPFQRLGADRVGSDDGSGLGLSIVAAVAEAHGGRLDLRARPGGGLRAAVSLPRARRVAA
ncbi:sensor histidine kinase [Catellatospora coxensis]|uniref:histidine kinase n=1 Tax=Catellatospora coxensis TaxID=310354 RepID=A0A8J3P6N2_9ACTN|nr:HAMP domain-containing sensor histidine kinase [Catellatospora coxensis]GIG05971.1 sensor protein CutS [Catellatospora coxensis]